MREPNSEQQVAIEHNGGVLLSAGAGSGKTYVLVEHVIYLIKNFHKEHSQSLELEFKGHLRDYLSGIVLMTFTNKAAGEISIRLQKRLDLELNQYEDQSLKILWTWTREVIDSINISTIHGLCYQLLNDGYFPTLQNNLDIISDVEVEQRIKQLLNSWFVEYQNDCHYNLGDDRKIESVIAHQDNITNSLLSIFLDPQLREMWRNVEIDSLLSLDGGYLSRIFKLLDLGHLFDGGINLGPYDDYRDKKWYLFLEEFNVLVKEKIEFSTESLELFETFFAKHKGVRAPLKRLELDEINQSMDDLKILRGFLNKNNEHFNAFFNHRDGVLKEWVGVFLDIFKYVDKRYNDFFGVTFADLEFYVYKSLQNESYRERVNRDFRYFIVDEFQDTSNIQFSILDKLCNGDYSKIFCVGDVKQAIYGFRGGEVAVFEKCMSLVSRNFNLGHNYRSDRKIINFNNLLFDSILPLGKNFSGLDPFSVKSDGQTYPDVQEHKNIGKIIKLSTELSLPKNEKGKSVKLSNLDLNILEAKSTVNQIIELKKSNDQAEICLLYKNLGPSEIIINSLIEKNIGFTAQVKIPLGEDSIISLFTLCLEFSLSVQSSEVNLETKIRYISFLIRGHLSILSNSSSVVTEELLSEPLLQFNQDVLLIGVKDAFFKFIFSQGIYNGEYENNMNLIASLVQMGRDCVEHIYAAVKNYGEKKYSATFSYGEQSSNLVIMTTHASKGLEFDHVFLMGIHTNGRRMVDVSSFGKLPGSCRFRPETNSKKTFKTPTFILEGLINEHKDFSESKRLLYVACTRAAKGLYWSDFTDDGSERPASANCWIGGLRYFENHCSEVDVIESISHDTEVYEPSSSTEKVKRPFFHQDPVGVLTQEYSKALMTLSELSVTRLASVADCPRKFYLMNICKIDEKALDEISEVHMSTFKKVDKADLENISSSERGTQLHYEISTGILNESYTSRNSFLSVNDQSIVNSVLCELKSYVAQYDLHSEEQIKFSLYGTMISGIPDLVLRPNDKSKNDTIIYDFKTGEVTDQNEGYLCQLLCYAYAEYENGLLTDKDCIILRLFYIDTHIIIEKRYDFNEVKYNLQKSMRCLSSLQVINTEHCKKCSYSSICY